MNYDSLLNIINGIIKNEEKFEESPNEIYSLFKKHGYERDIETLKLDLKNLLNDVIKSDEELSKVAGGKVSKLAAGAVAALTCFPMNSFASGTANTNQNKHSAVNKITDSIKSGAKKVGDATKEHVIEPAKDAAKTIARNPGKSATVATVLVVYGLLSGLAGKKLGTLPELDTQGMTDEEKARVEETHKVLQELTEKSLIEMSGNEFSWNLSTLEKKPKGLSTDKIKIGELAAELMPGSDSSNEATAAYTSARNKYIKYEKALSTTLEQQKQKIEKQMEEQVTKLTTDNEALKTKAKQKEEELKKKTEELEAKDKKHEEELKQKEDKIKNLNAEHANQLTEKLEEQREAYENKLKEKEKEWTEREEELLAVSAELQMIAHAQKTVNEKLQKEIEGNKNANLLLSSYTNLDEIYNTINAALGESDNLDSLRNAVSNKGLMAVKVFRSISKKLRGETTKLDNTNNEQKLKGPFNLGELLLIGGITKNPINGKISSDDKDFVGFNLKVEPNWTDIEKLCIDATKKTSWVHWLAPVKGVWSLNGGLKETNVVKQLPELILAAAALTETTTLQSLLAALETLLTSPVYSDYREPVNTALQKVGMRFDDNICKLVSTNPSKK